MSLQSFKLPKLIEKQEAMGKVVEKKVKIINKKKK